MVTLEGDCTIGLLENITKVKTSLASGIPSTLGANVIVDVSTPASNVRLPDPPIKSSVPEKQ